jgi:hypothetical protein
MLAGALLLVVAIACTDSENDAGPVSRPSATEVPAADVETLGFLERYDQLAPGRKGQANLIYIDGEADFSAFSAILVEPVVAWKGPGGESPEASRSQAQALDAGLRRELAREFELVDRPRAGALRMRAALASKADSHLVLEVELLDAATGERVIAVVDHRALDATSEHASSANPIDQWPVIIRNRLGAFRQFDAAARAREDSEKP